MGASSVTGSGPGSAEGKLRGLTLDNIHKILKPNENRSSVILKGNRIQFGGSGQTQIEQTIFLPPFVTRIDSKNGIVYFNSEEQNVFSLGQGNSGQGNSGQGNSGQGNSGQGNSGQGNSGQGNSGSFDSQIEVWKYTRKKSGSHIKSNSTILSSRLGKRYKPLLLLPMGSNSWVVPDRYIYPARPGGNPRYRNYFRFGVRTTDGERSDISTITIATATGPEYDNGSGIKILIMGQGGV